MKTNSKSLIKAEKGVNLPNLRYVDDYLRLTKELNEQVDDIGALIKQQQKMLASLVTKAVPVRASFVIDVTPTDGDEQRKEIRKLRTKIDPALTNVQVPNLQKLQTQYALAEDLYEKHKTVESMEAELAMKFPDRRGAAYEAATSGLAALKAKIAGHLKDVLEFLSEVANKHVPKQFTKYVTAVAELIEEHCVFKESHSFMYVSTHEGNLLFTSYLMLVDAVNDDKEIAPHLYVSIQWMLGKESSISIDLNHEYELPNKLIGSGEEVGSVGEACRALSDMLSLESFSSALGVVPLALQLKVSPEKITTEMFSYRDVIEKLIVDEESHTLSFKLRKEIGTDAKAGEVAYVIFNEVKVLLKNKGVKINYKAEKLGSSYVLSFKIMSVSVGGDLNTNDLEFLRDKFKVSQSTLNKIARLLSNNR